MKLLEKVAIVTGGGSGIGAAVGLAYAAEGAVVLFADIDLARATEVAAQAASGKGVPVHLDVTQQSSIDAVVARAETDFGRLDILLNGAGIIKIEPLLEVSRESFGAVMDVNTYGSFFMLQAAARSMIRQNQGGKVINVASVAGRRGAPFTTQYCASKAATISVTQSAALALIEHGINVNAIAPGFIQTPMWTEIETHLGSSVGTSDQGSFNSGTAQSVAAGRLGTPGDLVGAAIFLASPDSAYVVGQTMNVDGGYILG